MVKWSKRDAVLPGGQVLFVRPSFGALWWWRVVESDASDNMAEGYAQTKEEAKACAIAVATALGWLKVEEKPERVLVDEWWEVQTRTRGMGPWLPASFTVSSSLTDARVIKSQRGCKFDRIVRVRRCKKARKA